MSDITIPPEAVEAAARALADAYYRQCSDGRLSLADTDDTPADWYAEARAALESGLKAWPGVHVHDWQRPWLGGMSGTEIILPLTETDND